MNFIRQSFAVVLGILMTIIVSQRALSTTLSAGMPKHRVAHKGVEVSIDRFFEDIQVFQIVLKNEPSVGPNFADTDALKKALRFDGSQKDFLKKMKRDEDAIFILKEDLNLLWQKEVAERQNRKGKAH